jgi:5'-nucleotidase
VRCDRTVSGTQGNYTAPSIGTTCLTGANVGGSLTIPTGARVSIIDSTIGGNLIANGAGSLVVCNSAFRSGVQVTRSTGPVVFGDLDQGCVGSNVAGSAQFTYNGAGVRLISNRIDAGLTVNDNSGGPTIIGANSVGGWLTCLRNNPAAVNGGRPNQSAARTGDCAAASF